MIGENTDHILFLRSDQSNSFYPENTPYHFKVHLRDPLYLDGKWEVALLDFFTKESTTKKNRHELYLFCDVCTGVTVFWHNQYSLLRRIFPNNSNNWNYVFAQPIFVRVKKTEIRDIEFHIYDETGKEASFLSDHFSCTLQVRQLL